MDEKKTITFSIFHFILNDNIFGIDDFISIKDNTDTPNLIGTDLVSVDRVEKRVYQKRFICFIFNFHERWPYSEKVLSKQDDKIIEKNNPRPNEDIELKDQFFVILDSESQRIYMSNRQKETHLSDFFKKNEIGDYIIKPIINERDFVENIKSIKEISFTVDNSNIFSQIDSLSKNLSNDIYGYGADMATVSLQYKKNKPIEFLKDKLNSIIRNKTSYKNITIVGRDGGSDFEKIFNLDGVINRVSIVTTLNENKEINTEDMLQSLILKIKKHVE